MTFTARSNFKTEFMHKGKLCKNCFKWLEGVNALVLRWTGKNGSKSFAVCDDECWAIFDHNYWLEKAWIRTDDESYLDDRLPIRETYAL